MYVVFNYRSASVLQSCTQLILLYFPRIARTSKSLPNHRGKGQKFNSPPLNTACRVSLGRVGQQPKYPVPDIPPLAHTSRKYQIPPRPRLVRSFARDFAFTSLPCALCAHLCRTGSPIPLIVCCMKCLMKLCQRICLHWLSPIRTEVAG